ncbi:MAG: hypothetical protein AAF357_18345, partial [Verrucomicrobiota bacterium]
MEFDLTKFAELYAKAEGAIKDSEIQTGELLIPAINQLRYAGHHVAKAWLLRENGSTDQSMIELELKKASNHCRRSYFDAKEAVMLERLEVIDSFFKDYYKSEFLVGEMPDWSDHYERARNFKQEVRRIRSSVYEDRTEMFDKIDPLVVSLGDICSKITLIGPRIAERE